MTEKNIIQDIRALAIEYFDPKIFAFCHNRVLTGPFAGMYIEEDKTWRDGNASLKVLGSYEFELHTMVALAIARWPMTVVNVGCADGYYAIGLARRLPMATVFAVDVDERSLEVVQHMAVKNDVAGRVKVLQGFHLAKDMDVGGVGKHLYVVDCEGDEDLLLDKTAAPHLANADIIVESHDFKHVGLRDKLYKRFSDTHMIDVIEQKPTDLEQFPFLGGDWNVVRMLLLTEKRPQNCSWLAMWAKETPVVF